MILLIFFKISTPFLPLRFFIAFSNLPLAPFKIPKKTELCHETVTAYFKRVGFGPRTPAPGPITFRLRLDWLYPVLVDSDGVGFETIRYYLIINTIKDLYCDVLRGIATTCDYAVTNCHGIYSPHYQFVILPKLLSPFEIKIISIRPPGFEPDYPYLLRVANSF